MTSFYTLKSFSDKLTFAFDRVKRMASSTEEAVFFADETGAGEIGQLASMTIALWPAPLLKF